MNLANQMLAMLSPETRAAVLAEIKRKEQFQASIKQGSNK